MNKTKFTISAANFVLAIALTISCSDDKDEAGSSISCKKSNCSFYRSLNGYNKYDYCQELASNYTEKGGPVPADEYKEECENYDPDENFLHYPNETTCNPYPNRCSILCSIIRAENRTPKT